MLKDNPVLFIGEIPTKFWSYRFKKFEVKKNSFGLPHLATCIFLIFSTVNQGTIL